MSEAERDATELARLLGRVSEVPVPPLLDSQVQLAGRMLVGRLARERECPAAFVWSVFVGVAMALLIAVLPVLKGDLSVLLPALKGELAAPLSSCSLSCIIAGLNLLALFSGSVILIRKRMEGGGHG